MRLFGFHAHLWLCCFLVVTSTHATAPTGSQQCAFNMGNCPLPQGTHHYVQDYGYGGFESYLTTAARYSSGGIISLARDLISGDGPVNPQCVPSTISTNTSTGIARTVRGSGGRATVEETLALQRAGDAGRGYRLVTPGRDTLEHIRNLSTEELDRLQEELVFLSAMSNVHQFTQCQDGLFRSYFGSEIVRREMLENAYAQFLDIRPTMIPIMRREADLSARRASSGSVIATRPGEGCIREHCRTPTVQDIETARDMGRISQQITNDRQVIESLVSRIPMANRDSMRARMLGLIASPGEVSEDEFHRVFDAEMRRMDQGVQDQLAQIQEITVAGSNGNSYCIDGELKKNLVRSGQVESSIQSLGLAETLGQFSQRAGNRYGMVGEIGTELVLIPTYFVGYGFARLGARAGLSTVRAVAMSGRALSTTTRFAMLGLEAVDWATVFAAVVRDCHSQTFYSRVEGKQCNPHEEIGQVYEESSMAQCLTSVLLPTVTALAGTTVRLANSRRLDQIYNGTPPRTPPGAEAVVEEVVVTAPRSPRFLTEAQVRSGEARLRTQGINLADPTQIHLTTAQVATLSDPERILVVNRLLGVNLSRQRGDEILAFMNRALPASARRSELIRILERSGFTADEARTASRRLLSSGLFGDVPRIQLMPEPAVVARATTDDLNRANLDALRLGGATPIASSDVLRSTELPLMDADVLRNMLNRPAYRQVLNGLSPQQQLYTAQALKRLEQSGLSPQQAVRVYRDFERHFRYVSQIDHGAAFLAEYIARRRRLGIPDHVIRRRIEEQFPGCRG